MQFIEGRKEEIDDQDRLVPSDPHCWPAAGRSPVMGSLRACPGLTLRWLAPVRSW